MPRISTLISLAVHAVVIGAAVTWSVAAPGPIPIPRDALAFQPVEMVQIKDIPLPPPQRRESPPSSETVSKNAAPLTPPDRIIAETGLEGRATDRRVPGDVAVDGGVPGGLPGRVDTVAPPPPPPTPPQQPTRIHTGMQPPRKVVDVKPVYPPIAQASRREGIVILEVVIDPRGNVSSVSVLRSIPLLDDAAVDAVRQWKFTPTLLNGEAVPIVMTVTVNFRLQ